MGRLPPVIASLVLGVVMTFGQMAPVAEEGLFVTSSVSESWQFTFPCPAAVLTLQG